MKVKELVATLAHALGLPKARVNVLAIALRNAGLIGSAVRRKGAPEVTATDVANLLLAAMGTAQADEAPDVVKHLRAAEMMQHVAPAKSSVPPMLPDLPVLSARHSLGEMLDAIFLGFAVEGDLVEEHHGLPITNMTLTVTFPHRVSYQAELWIDTGDEAWTFRYQRKHPAFDGEPSSRWNEIARSLLDGKGDMVCNATVTSSTFYALSEALGAAANDHAADQLSKALRRSR